MVKVKITVIKKLNRNDIFGDNPPVGFAASPECDRFQEGQEFIFDGNVPPGFCPWAFADIQKSIALLRLGGNFPEIEEKGVGLPCCTDGARPVIFKLERIED